MSRELPAIFTNLTARIARWPDTRSPTQRAWHRSSARSRVTLTAEGGHSSTPPPDVAGGGRPTTRVPRVHFAVCNDCVQ